jgi:hypothetical protein
MADEVHRMVRLLEEAVARSGRGHREIERAVGLVSGTLDELFADRAELAVRHLLLVARELGLDPVLFFQGGLQAGAGGDPVLEEIERAFHETYPALVRPRMDASSPPPDADLDLAAAKELVRQTIREELARLARGEPLPPSDD